MASWVKGTGGFELSKLKEKSAEKQIDFKELLSDYRRRTETKMPYTMMRVEDAMFVDSKRLVALEYIYYDRRGAQKPTYHKLTEVKGGESLLGLEDYACDSIKYPMNAFVSNVGTSE